MRPRLRVGVDLELDPAASADSSAFLSYGLMHEEDVLIENLLVASVLLHDPLHRLAHLLHLRLHNGRRFLKAGGRSDTFLAALQNLAEVQPRVRPRLRIGVDLSLDLVACADSNAFFNYAHARRERSGRELGCRSRSPSRSPSSPCASPSLSPSHRSAAYQRRTA